MKNYRVLAPLALAAAAALAAGVAALLKKPVEEAVEAAAPKAQPAVPRVLMVGSYSFISGFQNAVTVEMEMDYDSEKYSFVVIEDEFPSYSSDSHVAVVYGEDFNLQIEYAAFYRARISPRTARASASAIRASRRCATARCRASAISTGTTSA